MKADREEGEVVGNSVEMSLQRRETMSYGSRSRGQQASMLSTHGEYVRHTGDRTPIHTLESFP